MSGLGSFNTGGNSTYLRIGMGLDEKERPRAIIAKRAKQGDPGAVAVTKKGGEPALDKEQNQVYRTEHAFVEGAVIRMERAQPEYNGKKMDVLNITFDAGHGQLLTLQLDKGDAYWGDFALRLPNIDFTKPLKLQPFSIPREDNPDKRNRYLVAYQGGSKVEKFWNKDSDPETAPPQPYLDEDEGKWMWGKRNNWIDQNPIQNAIDKVEFLNNKPSEFTALDAAAATAQGRALEDNELPPHELDDMPW